MEIMGFMRKGRGWGALSTSALLVSIVAIVSCGTEDPGDSDDGEDGADFCDRDGDRSDRAGDALCTGDDCDDENPSVNPSATDTFGDGVDQKDVPPEN